MPSMKPPRPMPRRRLGDTASPLPRVRAPNPGRPEPVATTTRYMPVAPESVWDALADPGSYGYWVVGSKVIRDADADWPAPGSRFHHTVGAGLLKASDHTKSLEASRPRRLAMRAKARPFGSAR